MGPKIVQYRLVLLVGALATAALLALLEQANIRTVSATCAALLLLLTLGLFLAGLAASNAHRPATFLIREGTFTTAPDAPAVLSAAALTTLPMAALGRSIHHTPAGFDLDRYQIATAAVLLLLLPLPWSSVLGTYGLSLRPDGILDRQRLGSAFVPWEAGLTAQPTRSGVRLRAAHPDLVVRHGWRPAKTLHTGADHGFTAWAINLYATHPEYRPMIGTHDGLHQLTARHQP